jgi:UDP-2,4-diacetamido-2,4,6-trideoxy-beta-L-altropyranose hydrolase
MPKTIAFRVDADSKMGTGHFVRCHAIARACEKRGWRVIWITASRGIKKFFPGSKSRTKLVFVPKKISPREHAWRIRACLSPGSVVVLDGYRFSRALERELALRDLSVVTIDDNALRRFASQWVINGNVHAEDLAYRGEKNTRFALGPKFYILSEEVVKAGRIPKRVNHKVKKILVTMGGADPSNQTLKVLQALAKAPLRGVMVAAVAGAANRNFKKLSEFARTASYRCRVLRATTRMGGEMAKADLGISAGGRVANEMLYVGLPGLRIVLADNQAGLVRKMHRAGAAINLGWHRRVTAGQIGRNVCRLIDDIALRRKMSHKGRAMIDGKGTERILKILSKL